MVEWFGTGLKRLRTDLVSRFQGRAISTLGQQSLGKVQALLELCQLIRLSRQAVLDILQREGVLFQLIIESGHLGSRGSPPAQGPGYGPGNQYQRRPDDRESSQKNG